MAVLSASAIVIASAGSTFPLEAANFANTTAIVKDFELFTLQQEVRSATLQGQCDQPTLARQPSLLLPRDACPATGAAHS